MSALDKNKLVATITQLLDEKIESLKVTIKSNKDSRDGETKSSVGDKYETGRAMVQMELEKNRMQLNKTVLIRREIDQIDTKKVFTKVEFGSLVKTNQGLFFTTISLGKIQLEDQSVFCISLASPIGRMLSNKTTNDSFDFQGKNYCILEIS